MAGTMIEKCARAICEEACHDPDDTETRAHPSGIWLDDAEPWWTGYVGEVRAVLAALREPDEGMIEAGAAEAFERSGPDQTYSQIAIGTWQAVIDAILAEKYGPCMAETLNERSSRMFAEQQRARATAEFQGAVNDTIEACAALCDQLGDSEFAKIALKSNIGIATLAQRHYIACAKAIRELKTESPSST